MSTGIHLDLSPILDNETEKSKEASVKEQVSDSQDKKASVRLNVFQHYFKGGDEVIIHEDFI